MAHIERSPSNADGSSPGVAELVSALRNGRLTARAAVTAALDRIEAAEPHVNAFRIVRRSRALAEADDADRRLAAGEHAPLLGVPVAIKDDVDIAGEPTMIGCGGHVPPASRDSELVRRLRAAGAVVVGKTNMCELGQWPFTDGRAFGHTRNPWALDRTPGGSSGGSACAVAAGLVPAAFGSDGAGSVRIPAAWTNLVGIKPQRDRISPFPHADLVRGLTVYGPLARTVKDAALLLDAVSGPHELDRNAPPPVTVSDAVESDPGRLRIAVAWRAPFTSFRTPLHREVRAGVQRIADTLSGLGHDVTAGELRYGPLVGASFLPRSMVGIRDQLVGLPAADIDPRSRIHARNGLLLSGPPLAAARAIEPLLRRRIGKIFADFDVVLSPTTATPPPAVHAMDGLSFPATEKLVTTACPYTWPWNVLGWPSVNVPAGFTGDGLPVGAQLMGPANSEPLLVSIAAQLESQLRWDLVRPSLPWIEAAG